MSPAALELALKKQRLQLAATDLRQQFGRHATGVAPVFAVADQAVAGVIWLRQHPQVLVAGTVALLVARPRKLWRLARRSFFLWQTWRRVAGFLSRNPAA